MFQTQGRKQRGLLAPPLAYATIFLALVLILQGTGAAATEIIFDTDSDPYFTDYTLCLDPAPDIDFPENVTVGKDYLVMVKCKNIDSNYGDHVAAWVTDNEGSPILAIGELVTQQDHEHVGMVSDSNGLAWDRINIDPYYFDGNTTGKQYSININWDGKTAADTFFVFTPTVTLKKYRTELANWETLHIEAHVTDNKGNRMVGVPCSADVLNFQRHEDTNSVKIEQRSEVIYTDLGGYAEFDFGSGLTTSLLQGFEYTPVITCLGGDANFTFQVVTPNSQYLNNPIYNFLNWAGANFIAIFFGIVIALAIISIVGLGLHQLFSDRA